jgi:hypothetical protein
VLDSRTAARLLSTATSARDLAPIAVAAGCDGRPLALDDDGLRRIGIHSLVGEAWVAAGPDALRALMVELAPATDETAVLREISARLTRCAPHLWLLIARGSELSIACWSADRRRPRVSALRVDASRVLPSDAETVAALADAPGGADVLVHQRWLEILGRDALTARFYRSLESLVRRMADEAASRVPPDERRAVALLQVTRLLFLSFLESKGWLAGDRRFLARTFEQSAAEGGAFHRRVLNPLFFGTLNTPMRKRAPVARAFGRIPFLNGGLFARTALERRHAIEFSDDIFGQLFDELLLRYRFTPREESTSWNEAAVDPEMLGRAFESLMVADERRVKGAFYTPLAMVSSLVDRALAIALHDDGVRAEDIERALAGERVRDSAAHRLRDRLARITILDPACGSGAFLVHALERASALISTLGDERSVGAIRRSVLSRSIFGVDIDPTAVWLCELRLWLAVVVEQAGGDAMRVEPLPNLDHQIRVGDSLGGELPADVWRQPGGSRVAKLRERYARASGARKRIAARVLDRAERERAIARVEAECAAACAARRDMVAALRGRDLFGARVVVQPEDRERLTTLRARIRFLRGELRRLREGGALPFAWSVHAADVLDAGGFDCLVGNPPWVRIHNIPQSSRSALRARFSVFSQGTWTRGMEVARAGRGFAAQVDLAALFVERGLGLTRPGGALAFLLPAKLWRSLAGGGVRRLLTTKAVVAHIEDWSGENTAFDAAVYPSGIVARAGAPVERTVRTTHGRTTVRVHRARRSFEWCTTGDSLSAYRDDPAAPWLLLPPEARVAFVLLRDRGIALADAPLGPPVLGVKTGLNDAFVVKVLERRGEVTAVDRGDRQALVETALLRPLIRGETLGRSSDLYDEMLIWTHDSAGLPLRRLPPHAARLLAPYEDQLRRRADLRPGMPWWSLFRTPSARHDRARVVWADVAREPRVRILEPRDPTVALNSCYLVQCKDLMDARTLGALLQSPVCTAWLRALGEPARGGYLRYLAWTVALLPLPRDWSRARRILCRRDRRASPGALIANTAAAYGLQVHELMPLIEWNAL